MNDVAKERRKSITGLRKTSPSASGVRKPRVSVKSSPPLLTKHPPNSFLCNPQLRDPLTTVYSYVPNPAPFRSTCQFLVECFNHAMFLEVDLGFPWVSYQQASPMKAAPSFVGDRAPIRLQLLCNNVFRVHTSSDIFLKLNLITELHLVGLTHVRFTDSFQPGSNVRMVEVAHLLNLVTLGTSFLFRATRLEEVRYTNLPQLTSVGDNWMCDCPSLERIKICNLPQLRKIGHNFLSSCTDLVQVTMRDMPELRYVGRYWLHGCTSLTSFTLADFPSLYELGAGGLTGCSNLKSVVLKCLPHLWFIGAQTLQEGCPSLDSVRCIGLPDLDRKRLPDDWEWEPATCRRLSPSETRN